MTPSIFPIIVLTFVLGACATPYQSSGLTGGFKETALGEDVFQVSFQGNAFIPASRVADYTLLRSAELTLERGYRYFVIVDEDDHTSTGTITAPTTTYATTYGNSTTYNTYGGNLGSYSKASSRNIIACFREKPEGFSFDASQVVDSLRAKYGLTGAAR